MKNNPKVAIIVPIYNVENYLNRCLDSLINQTYSNLLFVLVNDGSSDRSVEIAKTYCSMDSRFVLIDKKNNGGLSRARNTGIDFLKGDFVFKNNQYIMEEENNQIEIISSPPPPQLICDIEYIEFLDSDDYLENNCIEVSVQYAQQYQLDLVCAGINQVSNRYEFSLSTYGLLENIEKNKILEGIEILKKVKTDFFYASWDILINFDFVKKNKPKFIEGIIYEDHYFGLILFLKAKRIMVLEYYFYNYVNSLNSITRPKEITQNRILLEFQSWKKTIEKLCEDIHSTQEIDLIQKYIRKFYFPMLCKNYLKLDSSIQQEFKKDIKEKEKKYGSLKTFLMLNFPKLFFLLKKIKNFFRE